MAAHFVLLTLRRRVVVELLLSPPPRGNDGRDIHQWVGSSVRFHVQVLTNGLAVATGIKAKQRLWKIIIIRVDVTCYLGAYLIHCFRKVCKQTQSSKLRVFVAESNIVLHSYHGISICWYPNRKLVTLVIQRVFLLAAQQLFLTPSHRTSCDTGLTLGGILTVKPLL